MEIEIIERGLNGHIAEDFKSSKLFGLLVKAAFLEKCKKLGFTVEPSYLNSMPINEVQTYDEMLFEYSSTALKLLTCDNLQAAS